MKPLANVMCVWFISISGHKVLGFGFVCGFCFVGVFLEFFGVFFGLVFCLLCFRFFVCFLGGFILVLCEEPLGNLNQY